MPASSAARPMSPSNASTSRTSVPLPTPPMEGCTVTKRERKTHTHTQSVRGVCLQRYDQEQRGDSRCTTFRQSCPTLESTTASGRLSWPRLLQLHTPHAHHPPLARHNPDPQLLDQARPQQFALGLCDLLQLCHGHTEHCHAHPTMMLLMMKMLMMKMALTVTMILSMDVALYCSIDS